MGFCASATLLAGCGGLEATPAGFAAMPQRAGAGTALLYVANNFKGDDRVSILSFPDGKRVATITGIGYVFGPCADGAGNVWVPTYQNYHKGGSIVYEYAHGGTKPIAQIQMTRHQSARGCAVDPVTGNLAVLGNDSIEVFRGAVQGKPIDYSLRYVTPLACTYDGDGNLFFDGLQGSTSFFLLAELTKGQKKFEFLQLHKRVGFPSGIVWDGQYVAIATGGNGMKSVIYRFTVSGKTAEVVQTVHPKGLFYQPWIAVYGDRVVGTTNPGGDRIRLWPYPTGGASVGKIPGLFKVTGLAISVGKRP
jgi:hypothetical protein